jgi:hypothetical protein
VGRRERGGGREGLREVGVRKLREEEDATPPSLFSRTDNAIISGLLLGV